jgi:hypothetical protein
MAEEVGAQDLRRRADDFFARLRDTTLPPVNPLQGLCDLLGLSRPVAAGAFNYSYGRWSNILLGGSQSVPNSVLEVVENLSGKDGRFEFEAAWSRFRESLGAQSRGALEKALTPLGGGGVVP